MINPTFFKKRKKILTVLLLKINHLGKT